MNPSACPAAKLLEVDRIDLAVLAFAGTATITDLAAEHDVSGKLVYQRTNKASAALAEVFASSAPHNEVLFELPVTSVFSVLLEIPGVSAAGGADPQQEPQEGKRVLHRLLAHA
ncbi:hypothetical protein ACFQAT_27050 [Undibacterium arcticum]|uniref:TetR family transcriptional regulator n=1 Tax=Undibacterium arcticum TaxID=1762892 RepID=A0ABV7F156_9BURK